MNQYLCKKGLKGREVGVRVNELETFEMLFEDSLGITPNHTSKVPQTSRSGSRNVVDIIVLE